MTIGLILALVSQVLWAANGIPVFSNIADSATLTHDDDSVRITITVSNRLFNLTSRQAAIIEPMLIGHDGDTITLPTIGYYAREHYYHIARNGPNAFQTPTDWRLRTRRMAPQTHYAASVAYKSWMEHAHVDIRCYLLDGCGNIESERSERVAGGEPTIVQGKSTIETIHDQNTGTAYVDFIVNRTELVPDLHDNQRELAKIGQSLDSILADTTAIITRITIIGYASPEGSYDNNVRLASGRSETLARYIAESFGIERHKMFSTFVPEDWEGLRRYIRTHSLPNRDAVLKLATEPNNDPDRQLALIKQRYPADYQIIAKEALPYLRHSDYVIEYEHRALVHHAGLRDTIWQMPLAKHEPLPARPQLVEPYQPLLALKTNVLFDIAMTPNFELEWQLGRNSHWSIMLEDWFPWWLYKRNKLGDTNKYRREGEKAFRHSYEIWALGAELRYWFWPPCPESCRPYLTGTFVGVYGAGGKYDWEWGSTGDQGEFTSFGLTVGKAWAIGRHWNIELSAGAGYVGGPRRHYRGEFDDTHLIYKYSSRIRYIGPTQLKLSVAWLIGSKKWTRRHNGDLLASYHQKGGNPW